MGHPLFLCAVLMGWSYTRKCFFRDVIIFVYLCTMKSPKEITVEQWLMRLTQELVDITPEEDNLPLHVINDLINNKDFRL